MRVSIIALSFLLLLSACDNATDPSQDAQISELSKGSVYGYVSPYSGCNEVVNKAGFKVSLLRARKSVLTDSNGNYRMEDVPVGIDTVLVQKEGYQSSSVLVEITPMLSTYTYLVAYRNNAFEAKYTADWTQVVATSEVEADSFYVNSNGDLVKQIIFKTIIDTFVTIETTVLGDKPPAFVEMRIARNMDGSEETSKGHFNRLPLDISSVGNTRAISLYHLKRVGKIHSGDTVYAYIRALGSKCGNQDPGAYTDVKPLVVP